MYIPKINKINNQEEIFRFIRENPFAIIISNNNDGIIATHTPVELFVKPDGVTVLRTHIAKANPQWKNFADAGNVMVIFNGPHTYISSSCTIMLMFQHGIILPFMYMVNQEFWTGRNNFAFN